MLTYCPSTASVLISQASLQFPMFSIFQPYETLALSAVRLTLGCSYLSLSSAPSIPEAIRALSSHWTIHSIIPSHPIPSHTPIPAIIDAPRHGRLSLPIIRSHHAKNTCPLHPLRVGSAKSTAWRAHVSNIDATTHRITDPCLVLQPTTPLLGTAPYRDKGSHLAMFMLRCWGQVVKSPFHMSKFGSNPIHWSTIQGRPGQCHPVSRQASCTETLAWPFQHGQQKILINALATIHPEGYCIPPCHRTVTPG